MRDEKPKKTRQIGFRISDEEFERIDVLYRRVKMRAKGRILHVDIIRELMGLDPPNLLSEVELARFRKETNAAAKEG